MKYLFLVLLAVLSFAVSADIKITAPAQDETVIQIQDVPRAFLQLSRDERKEYFFDKEKVTVMRKGDYDLPKPVDITWEDSAPQDGKLYTVVVKRLPDGKVFFKQETADRQAAVFNLEIARNYELSVTAGDASAKLTFKSEDLAPRLLKFETIRNARDCGGRLGLNGRRVKQSMMFRTSGLNNNATIVYYTLDEVMKLHEEGKLKDMGEKGASLERHIQRNEPINPKFIRLIKSTPDKPGLPKLNQEQIQRLLDTYGIKTDVDLRSDLECYGMKGSPLGPTVKWYQHTYNSFGYADIFSQNGHKSLRTLFTLLIDKDSYPLVYHCIGGADRTGALAFILNALLGVDEDELYKDYEATGFRRGGGILDKVHKGWFDTFVKRLHAYKGDTIREKVENFMLSCDITMDEINAFRAIMLE